MFQGHVNQFGLLQGIPLLVMAQVLADKEIDFIHSFFLFF